MYAESGAKKERLVFVNDRGLAQPTKKHEKRRSRHERALRVLFREFEGANFCSPQSTNISGMATDYIMLGEKMLFSDVLMTPDKKT